MTELTTDRLRALKVLGAESPHAATNQPARISYQTVSCGTDGVMTSCVDSRNQAGSYTLGATNPLLDRPNGTGPF